ncbi:hypothetical protein [Streptomyces sp. NBC_01481]|uniref:hypothetical protein n=1 Tax=Streptomyces sp. NBC_01481 TaxID=2975869 RepID=UPI0022528060|nr:hypothetical protein [Streptomyces sp. NBC_01481]MCX4581513.1 hypothetical protein [Streptomyces sp. NBC_01481]
MGMYAPKGQREVHLLRFDGRQRIGLVRHARDSLSLPTAACAPQESYREAVCRLVDGAAALRFGGVVARLDVYPHGAAAHRKVRLFTAHAERSCSASWLWMPWRQAVLRLPSLGTSELAEFVEGYLEGWIPDGWITLTADLRR